MQALAACSALAAKSQTVCLPVPLTRKAHTSTPLSWLHILAYRSHSCSCNEPAWSVSGCPPDITCDQAMLSSSGKAITCLKYSLWWPRNCSAGFRPTLAASRTIGSLCYITIHSFCQLGCSSVLGMLCMALLACSRF